jgi:hypothetical protein
MGTRTAAGLALSAATLITMPSWAASEAAAGPPIRLRVRTFDPLLYTPALPDRLRWTAEPVRGYFLVQLEAELDPGTEARLRALGVERLGFVPDRAYVVRLPEGAAAALRRLPGVRWVGAVEPGFKLSPDVGVRPFADPARRTGDRLLATVDLYPGEDLERTAARLDSLGIEVLHRASFSDVRRLTVRATLAQLERAARVEAVSWIEEAPEITTRNIDSRGVIQGGAPGLTPVWNRGLHGEGQILGHIDGPIYYKSCYFLDLAEEIPGPLHRKIIAYRAFGAGPASHGTHTAGILAGDSVPVAGSIGYSGLASAARITHTDLAGITGVNGSPSNLYDFLTLAHQDGARVHSNSWGDDGTTAYTPLVRDVDLFSWDHEDSLVVFASSNSPWLHTPENAKDVLAVGASHNGAMADEFCSAGSGPTADGRRKPEIFAPGCEIYSAENQSLCGSIMNGGTSMAAPAIAAAGALVRQYFVDGFYPSGARDPADARVPSGALIKAVLLNSAADMTGMPGFPGEQEGYGRVLLDDGLYFAGDRRGLVVLADVRNARGLSTGVADHFTLLVRGADEPLEVTLVFTEPPAAPFAASATVNDLDLELISPSGLRYLGNRFDTEIGESVPGGLPDALNNVEVIRLSGPEVGEWRIAVRGTAIRQGLQGYALVATGSIDRGKGGTLRHHSHVVDDGGPLGNANGAADPGETVTLSLALLNLSEFPAEEVSGRLFSSRFDRATVAPGTAAFPPIPAGGVASSLAPHYQVRISPGASCGEPLVFRVRSTHASGSGDSTFALLVGAAAAPSEPPSCQPLVCPAPGFTTVVSPALTAIVEQGDLRFSWPEVPGATAYELWRSADRDFSTAELVGSFPSPDHVERGELASPQTWYYRVRAVDACGWPSDP